MKRSKYEASPNQPDDLRGRSIRGGAILLSSETGLFLLQMAITVILARLIVPESFGLIASVTAVTGFLTGFQDLGLSTATIQREDITHAQISTLFWLNALLGLVLVSAVMALAPVLAWFYEDQRIFGITLAISIGYLIGSLAPQHLALLRREMQFGTIAVVKFASAIVRGGVGIGLALMGTEYWALIGMSIAGTCVGTAGLWVVSDWRPGRPVRGSGVRSMVRFGSELTASRIFSRISRSLDDILIGKYAGQAALGLYSKAYQLLLLPIQRFNRPIGGAVIPALSRLQHDPDRFKRYYQKGIEQMVFLGMPMVVLLFVETETIIHVVLGPNWSGAVPLFRALAPAAFLGTFNMANGWVYVTLGRTDRQLRWGMFGSTVRVIAFVIGVQWGALGVALAYSATVCLLRPLGIWYCYQTAPLRMRDLGAVLWRPMLASILAGLASWGILHTIAVTNLWLRLVVAVALYVGLYLSIWLLLPGGKSRLTAMLYRIRELFGHGQSA